VNEKLGREIDDRSARRVNRHRRWIGLQIRNGADGAGKIPVLRGGKLPVGFGAFGEACVSPGKQLIKRGGRRSRCLRYVLDGRGRRRCRGQWCQGTVSGIAVGGAHTFIRIKLPQIGGLLGQTFIDPRILDIARNQIVDLAGIGNVAHVFALHPRTVDIGGSGIRASAFFRKALRLAGALYRFLSLAGDGLFDTLIALRLQALCAGDDRNL